MRNEHNELHELVIFQPVKGHGGRVVSEVSVSAASISKAVKRVKETLGDSGLLVLQKSALPSLGIFKFENTARLHP